MRINRPHGSSCVFPHGLSQCHDTDLLTADQFINSQTGQFAVIFDHNHKFDLFFYRNSVNGGYLVPYETPQRLIDDFETGQEVEINLEESVIRNQTTNTESALNSLGDILPILEAGDIFAYARDQNMIA